MGQEEMSFKDISYLELWQPLCSVEWNHLCNLCIMRNNSVKFFEFGPVVQEEMFKESLRLTDAQHTTEAQRTKTDHNSFEPSAQVS